MTIDQSKKLTRKVRLPDRTLKIICSAFQEIFTPNDELWLFGSRTKLDARGGDIDLFIKTTLTDAKKAVAARLMFLKKIFLQLDEQKIDVVVLYTGQETMPIHKIAQKTEARLL